MMQVAGVYTTSNQEESILLHKYAQEMGGTSQCFSNVSRPGVDVALLNIFQLRVIDNVSI